MGGLMAGRLLDAGHSLTVFDTSAAAVAALTARGTKSAASPAAVGDAAEIVLASLPTPAIVQKATLGEGGLIHGSKVKTFIDVSTTGPRVASAVAKGLAEKNVTAVDSPVSGGLAGGRHGTLAVLGSSPRPGVYTLGPNPEDFG